MCGLISMFACFYLTGKCPFTFPPTVLQSVTSTEKLSLTQRNRELYFLMCLSDYLLFYFIIIHLCFMFCHQTESSSRGWIIYLTCIYNEIWKYFVTWMTEQIRIHGKFRMVFWQGLLYSSYDVSSHLW